MFVCLSANLSAKGFIRKMSFLEPSGTFWSFLELSGEEGHSVRAPPLRAPRASSPPAALPLPAVSSYLSADEPSGSF
jgi:hypothetical protein